MDEGFGDNFITIEDEQGNKYELEHLDTLEYEGEEYMVFLPADMDENNPDYGLIILQVVEVDGEEQFDSVDDEDKLQKIYDYYMELVYADEEESSEE